MQADSAEVEPQLSNAVSTLTDLASSVGHDTLGYACLLLSSDSTLTVPPGLGKFLNSDEAPWNYLMAAAIIYAIPPVIIYYTFRRHMSGGLTAGGVKG